jgi:hypothetical protein
MFLILPNLKNGINRGNGQKNDIIGIFVRIDMYASYEVVMANSPLHTVGRSLHCSPLDENG